MASENHASFARIGFTVFVGIAAIIATLVYLGGVRGSGDEVLVETYYDRPVSGLSVGSVVNFRGVKIGEVREISFIGNHYEVQGAENSRIYILMSFDRHLLGMDDDDIFTVRQKLGMLVTKLGLRATVTASGITGLSRIECDFYAPEMLQDETKISWTPNHVMVPPKVSLLDSFSDSATRVMNQINKMDLTSVWSNVSASVEALSRMTDSAKVMIESRQADMETIMENISSISTSAKALAEELKRNPSLLIRERQPRRLTETER